MRDPGYYCHQVRIEQPVNTRSSDHGAPEQEWEHFRTIWCRVVPVAAAEQQKATGQIVLSVFEIHGRYAKDITEKMRGTWLNESDMVLGFTGLRPNREEDELIIDCAGVKA